MTMVAVTSKGCCCLPELPYLDCCCNHTPSDHIEHDIVLSVWALSPAGLVGDDILRVCLAIFIHTNCLISCRHLDSRVEACKRLPQLAVIC